MYSDAVDTVDVDGYVAAGVGMRFVGAAAWVAVKAAVAVAARIQDLRLCILAAVRVPAVPAVAVAAVRKQDQQISVVAVVDTDALAVVDLTALM